MTYPVKTLLSHTHRTQAGTYQHRVGRKHSHSSSTYLRTFCKMKFHPAEALFSLQRRPLLSRSVSSLGRSLNYNCFGDFCCLDWSSEKELLDLWGMSWPIVWVGTTISQHCEGIYSFYESFSWVLSLIYSIAWQVISIVMTLKIEISYDLLYESSKRRLNSVTYWLYW